MDAPRLTLLDATIKDEEGHTSRNFRRELGVDVTEFDVSHGTIPDVFAFDGIVVTGSDASVYWDEDWIDATMAYVREAIDRGLPVLGVCFGHQLVAEVLGGTVDALGADEIGYREIDRVGESRLLDGLDQPFVSFVVHGDAVVELPPGADPIAETAVANYGFRKDRVFTVQFHPEFDAETARVLIESKEFLDDDRRAELLASVTEENLAAARKTKRLFDNFVEYVRSVGDGRALE